MLSGDWWIKADGSAVELGTSEHAEVALREMMKLPEERRLRRPDLFKGLEQFTQKEITAALKQGTPRIAIEHLDQKLDPRLYMMKYHGWIRVARNAFNVWKFDDAILNLIRASDYWTKQPKLIQDDMVDFEELSTGAMFSVSVKKLLNPAAEAEALKNMAMGVGRFHNPSNYSKQIKMVHVTRDPHQWQALDKDGHVLASGEDRLIVYAEAKAELIRQDAEQARAAGYGSNPPTQHAVHVPANIGPVRLNMNGRYRIFQPSVTEFHLDDRAYAKAGLELPKVKNPFLTRKTMPTQGARIIMGFNVGITPTWTVEDMINHVFPMRRKQLEIAFKAGYAKPEPNGGDIGATFVVQKGLWQPIRDDKAYPEDGASVVIFNTVEEDREKFEQDMGEIADSLAVEMKQDAVILEHTSHGAVTKVDYYGK